MARVANRVASSASPQDLTFTIGLQQRVSWETHLQDGGKQGGQVADLMAADDDRE
jgi:hypothetical protein